MDTNTTKILSMDLSMNLPCIVLSEITEDKKLKILDITYVDNKGLTGKKKKTNAQKLQEIHEAILELIDYNDLTNCKDLHVVRERGFSRFATETQAIFRVVGVTDLIGIQYLNIKDIAEITPPSVKKMVTGDGKASKKEVENEVRNYLPKQQKNFIFDTDDVSDAYAVGVAYAIKNGLLI